MHVYKFYSLAALICKMLFLPLENKVHIFRLSCVISSTYLFQNPSKFRDGWLAPLKLKTTSTLFGKQYIYVRIVP